MQRNTRRIVSWILVGIVLIFTVALSLIIPHVKAAVRIASDARRLSAVGTVAQLYAQDHGGAYPYSFATALQAEDQQAQFAFCALASDTSKPDPRHPYVYLGGGLTAGTIAASTVIAHTPLAYSDGRGANVLFGDGRVSWVAAADLPNVLARGGPATRPAAMSVR